MGVFDLNVHENKGLSDGGLFYCRTVTHLLDDV
jgi:hypothetical protein